MFWRIKAMAISEDEIIAHGNKFFDCSASDSSVEELNALFLNHDPRIICSFDGSTHDMHAQKDFYTKITDSRHTYEQMKITQLNHDPEVARATFSTYWEAKPRNKPNHLIKSVLSED
jgi:hypothetical protein